MTTFGSIYFAHNRYNPLLDQWVLACPHRLQRPWQGQVEDGNEEEIPEFDSKNPLCPGAERPGGKVNPNYTSTFAFDNDFSALREEEDSNNISKLSHGQDDDDSDSFFKVIPAHGRCRVMCFHPKSNVSLPLMDESDIVAVIDTWVREFQALASKYQWIQIFENKGSMMGCSNPHPHCQIWASDFMPNDPRTEDRNQRAYSEKHSGRPMLLDYLNKELQAGERIVVTNDHWAVVVPFWAYWPFETMLLPRRAIQRIDQLTSQEKVSLASILKQLLTKYDNLFHTSFPYSMGWHGAPTGSFLSDNQDHWLLHAHFFPPLVRSATVKKFMAGYELLAQSQRDFNPEIAASQLRELTCVHYKNCHV